MTRVLVALLWVVVLTGPFVALEVGVDLHPWGIPWFANAPIADVAALAVFGWAVLRARPLSMPPGAVFLAALLGVALVSSATSPWPSQALHDLVRKPVFMILVYGVGLASVIRDRVPPAQVLRAATAATLLVAVVSLGTSAVRIASGDGLWFARLSHLTPNHKTLAIAVVGFVPFLLRPGIAADDSTRTLRAVAVAVVTAAVAASASKTAAIALLYALGACLPVERPLLHRTGVAVVAVAAVTVLALAAPFLLESRAMLDAMRSRHSLDLRALEMVQSRPFLGMGVGSNVRVEMITFPHYRINGVDAHGVIQKVASETGLLGLAAYAGFALASLRALRQRVRDGHPMAPAAWTSWVALHLALLFSTETWSSTHWIPWAVGSGLSMRKPT